MAKKERHSKRKKRGPKPQGQSAPGRVVALYVSPTEERARQEQAWREHENREKQNQEDRYRRKLTRQMQHEVCLLIALGHSDRYIAEEIQNKYEIKTHWTTINQAYRNGPNWRRTIRAFKKRYITNISKHAISDKGWRLRIIQQSLVKAVEGGKHQLVSTLMAQAQDIIEGAKPLVEIHDHKTNHFTFNGKDGIDPSKIKEMPIGDSIRDINDRLSAQFIG